MPTFSIEAYQFMREHAGYSYRPTVETPEQGRVRYALELARAEHAARAAGARFVWENDHDAPSPGGNATGPFFGCILVTACECCGHEDERASLWGIDAGEEDPYRRTVEADLALEAGLCHPSDRAL